MKKLLALVLLVAAASVFADDSTLPFFRLPPAPKPSVNLFSVPKNAPPAQDRHEYDDATGPQYFMCPKDQAMLRVPSAKKGATFKCPVDGTEMRPGAGKDGMIFLLDQQK